jgi:hypothetical protein
MTRPEALRFLGAAGGLLGLSAAAGGGSGGMGGGMMGAATAGDMGTYMELFARHRELRRTVEEIPGGVRTITESDAPELVAQLQAHVASMYEHLDQGAEVSCMSGSLPALFRNANGYQRRLTTTPRGVVVVTETSNDPRIIQAIRAHAHEARDQAARYVQSRRPARRPRRGRRVDTEHAQPRQRRQRKAPLSRKILEVL